MAKSKKKNSVKAAGNVPVPGFTNITSPGRTGMVKVPKAGTSHKGSTPASRRPKKTALIPGK